MRIGIIGSEGIVGSACAFGFEKIGHEVIRHDIVLDSDIEDVKEADIVFICVPTPCDEEGKCDISVVETVVRHLHLMKYSGVVAIKSTVTPGTTTKLFYENNCELRLCFVPEFLRERCAISDFVENQKMLVIGIPDYHTGNRDFDPTRASVVLEAHGSLPWNATVVSSTTAESVKYFCNTMRAARIVFANTFHAICEKTGADYSKVKQIGAEILGIPDVYLDVNDKWKGYGGTCLPKDTKALAYLCDDLDLGLNLFRAIDQENQKFTITVPEGMRV